MSDKHESGVLESNRLAGTRLELLLFRLDGPQLYGINVFKVQEVVPYRQLTQVPGSHPLVNGIATLRGKTMTVIDLARAIGRTPLPDPRLAHIIITEYNRSTHGFLVGSVERIVYTQWENVRPRPHGIGRESFMTAVTRIDDQLIEILDVEKVLDQVVHASTDVSAEFARPAAGPPRRVLVADDSRVARTQIQRALEQIGVECTLCSDGKEAFALLQDLRAQGTDIAEHFLMLISDIEMPEMDGYMLTTAVRHELNLADFYILLHSSISGVFNKDMVARTGANRFIQKYSADDLAQAVLELL